MASAPAPSLLNSQSLSYVESLYADYTAGKTDTVPEEWLDYFHELTHGSGQANGNGNGNGNTVAAKWSDQPPFPQHSIFNPPGAGAAKQDFRDAQRMGAAAQQEKLNLLIHAFRVVGHMAASLDPLGTTRPVPPELNPANYGFTAEDNNREFSTYSMGGPDVRTLKQIVHWLKETYCRTIGVQYMHINNTKIRNWLQERMESTGNRLTLSRAEQRRILERLADAELFEEFISVKFQGAKSFSLEGGEALIPMLDLAIERAGEEGVREVVIGMAHRGRLNVLANIMGKNPRQIYREFMDQDPKLHFGRGDVKYHLGYSTNYTAKNGNRVHLSLCFNPSHLEYVNTVAQGRMAAKMDRFKDFDRRNGCVFLIHGDAAFAGEGIVQETLNLSQLEGYKTGGTIHIIINNQVGFTTDPSDARSTEYASDIAKMLEIPIFHVNGEDPEAVAQVVRLAMDFRKEFQRDVVIDMYCYRRRGHNEGDEPEFTQPLMYKIIKQRPSVFDAYLKGLKYLTKEESDSIEAERKAKLEVELTAAKSEDFKREFNHMGGIWALFTGGSVATADNPLTGLERQKVGDLLKAICTLPPNFTPHPKAARVLDARRQMAIGKQAFDWGGAEILAFASIIADGHRLRMSGQDVRRGTFSHRHAFLQDYANGTPFSTLSNISSDRGRVAIYNSPLSEAGVLGFEYGYSLDMPEGLTIWEAQFGDFVNAAQVIIDQFICSAEDKWDRLSGLVMLLPHGYEGQGPEHSSARLERFLTLAADDNMQICQPSTPAQYFHLLRRQVKRKWKKPLVVMTPKQLLRRPECVSPIDDFSIGTFQQVIGDPVAEQNASEVKRILLCSGRVYYDLLEARTKAERTDVAIIRIEEFYPLPQEALAQALKPYRDGISAIWVQDEPENMGAWRFLRVMLGEKLLKRFPFYYVSRSPSPSPAVGSGRVHKDEQAEILSRAFM
jgi:2-oxoglutarate dehydrogenase E1 component